MQEIVSSYIIKKGKHTQEKKLIPHELLDLIKISIHKTVFEIIKGTRILGWPKPLTLDSGIDVAPGKVAKMKIKIINVALWINVHPLPLLD